MHHQEAKIHGRAVPVLEACGMWRGWQWHVYVCEGGRRAHHRTRMQRRPAVRFLQCWPSSAAQSSHHLLAICVSTVARTKHPHLACQSCGGGKASWGACVTWCSLLFRSWQQPLGGGLCTASTMDGIHCVCNTILAVGPCASTYVRHTLERCTHLACGFTFANTLTNRRRILLRWANQGGQEINWQAPDLKHELYYSH